MLSTRKGRPLVRVFAVAVNNQSISNGQPHFASTRGAFLAAVLFPRVQTEANRLVTSLDAPSDAHRACDREDCDKVNNGIAQAFSL